MTTPRPYHILVVLLLVATLVLPYIGGYPVAYVIMVLILAICIRHYATPWRVEVDPGAAMLLLAFGILAVVYALNTGPERYEVIYAFNFVMLAFAPPLIVAVGRLARPGNILIVASLALMGALLALAVAFIQVGVLGLPRAQGFGSNPIPSAVAALLLGFLALAGHTSAPARYRWLFFLGPVAGFGVVLLAGSRGPLLAVPLLAIVALLLARLTRRALLAASIITVVAVSGVAWLLPSTMQRFVVVGEVVGEIAAGSDIAADLSSAIRMQMYQSGYHVFLDSPWIGKGWNGALDAAEVYAPTAFVGQKRHFHSDAITFAATAGVFGLVAYALILAAPLVSVFVSPRDSQYASRRYAAVVITVGYAACGAINILFGFEFLTTFYVAVAAIIVGFCRDQPLGAPG